MSVFQNINDESLINLIDGAQHRIVFVAPGIQKAVAIALGERLSEIDQLQVTVVIDPDENVCRIGYGDAEGLELLSSYAERQGLVLMSQPGLRVGVLLVDEETLIWSPTPLSVESAPLGCAVASELKTPNGVRLGKNPNTELACAVSAPGTDTLPFDAEIGLKVVTKDTVQSTLDGLAKNPPIPVNLARITRVFSSALQFVEFTVKGARFSKSELKISNDLINVDIQGDLKSIVSSRLRAFADYQHEEVEVPALNNGHEVFDSSQRRLMELVSEVTMQRRRNDLERRYLFNVSGFGRLIAKDDKHDLQRLVAAYEAQLRAYSAAMRKRMNEQANRIIDETAELIIDRASRAGSKLDIEPLRHSIKKGLDRTKDEEPEVKLLFKDVTYEQTQNQEFRDKVARALPASRRMKIGDWICEFDAALSG